MTDRTWSGRLFTWLRKGLAGMPAALRLNELLGVILRRLKMTEERLRTWTFIAMLVTMTCSIIVAVQTRTTDWERAALMLRVAPLEQRVLELEAEISAIQQQHLKPQR